MLSKLSRNFLPIGRNLLYKRCFSSNNLLNLENIAKFRKEHDDFLKLAKEQGEGNIVLTRKNRILELTISNKHKKNAISGKMMAELVDHLETITKEIDKNDDLLALVIRGDGEEAFASGADLAFVGDVLNTPEKGILMSRYMTPIFNALRDCPLIVVCYLNGFVVGGGAELSTVGDFRIMAEKTSENKTNFIQFVHAKIGASPGWGGGGRLTQIIGRKHALRILGTSVRVNAQDALNLGLVDAIHKTTDEKKQSYEEIINEFLKPYLDQPYPKSVRSMKNIVSATEPASNVASEAAAYTEFHNRWCSEDNIKAINLNKATHHHKTQ